MSDFKINLRHATSPGESSTDYTENGKWAMVSVRGSVAMGGVRFSYDTGGASSSFTVPFEMAKLLVLDLQEAIAPTERKPPEVPNDTPLGFAFNRSVADLGDEPEEKAA